VPTREELEDGFSIADWEILPARSMLRHGDREETPEPLVFKLLMALAIRDGDVASKEDLVADVWDGYPVSDDSITRCVAQLRKHFGEQGKAFIKTLPKRGYRLDEKVVLQTPDKTPESPAVHAPGALKKTRLWIGVAAIIVGFAIGFATNIGGLFGKGGIDSIAVLPFENLSGDEANDYLAYGFKRELLSTLSKIPNLTVKDGKVSYPQLEVGRIADTLDVKYVLSGTLQQVGGQLKFTYTVERGSNGKTVSAGEVVGEIGEEFALQADLADLVRNDLVGESAQQLISRSRYPTSDAFDSYMRGLFLLERRGRGRPENLDTAIELLEQAIERDPGFGPAYLSLASAYLLLPDYRNAPLAASHQLALEILERGIAEDESISSAAGAVIGFVHHKQRQWVQAEQAYIRATTAKVVDSNAFNWYSLMLSSVGRLDDALEQILNGQELDPSSGLTNSRVAISYTLLDNSIRAAEFFERSDQLDVSDESPTLINAVLHIRDGRMADAQQLISAAVSAAGNGTEWIEPVFAALADDSERDAAFTALDAASQRRDVDPRLDISARTFLGDVDGAMRVAEVLAQPDNFFEFDFLFLPELRPLRQHPGFLDLMQELGVKDYWDESGCVWTNDRVNCPD
jgi:DNA-binding winged helix-turn-helix (wHTH) protein/TolB-like protein/Tfp pilus assembly protein PilF